MDQVYLLCPWLKKKWCSIINFQCRMWHSVQEVFSFTGVFCRQQFSLSLASLFTLWEASSIQSAIQYHHLTVLSIDLSGRAEQLWGWNSHCSGICGNLLSQSVLKNYDSMAGWIKASSHRSWGEKKFTMRKKEKCMCRSKLLLHSYKKFSLLWKWNVLILNK